MPPPPANNGLPLSRWLTVVIAFSVGGSVMATELGLVRLAMPYLGASLPIWATIIALVLVSLALGAGLGGWMSRRGRVLRSLWAALALAGGVLVLTPLVLRALLDVVTRTGGVGWVLALGGMLSLAGIPLVLAGCAAPLLVHARAAGSADAAGSAAGLVSASSTVGSLVGTLLPAFVTLPLLGTSRTFLMAGSVLLGCTLLLHGVSRDPSGSCDPNGSSGPSGPRTGPGGVALLLMATGGFLAPFSVVPHRPGTVAQAESVHHHIRIIRRPAGHLVLELDAGFGEQSYYDPKGLLFYGPWPLMAASPLLRSRRNRESGKPIQVMILGLAGGTAARMLAEAFPSAQITGAELDGAIVEMARKHLALEHPRVRVLVEDGRVALRGAGHGSLDVIIIDANGHLHVPFHLVTRELFQIARSKLRPGGLVVVNLVRIGALFHRPRPSGGEARKPSPLLDAAARTAQTVFRQVYRLDLNASANTLLFFTDHPVTPDAVVTRATRLQPPEFATFAEQSFRVLEAWAPPSGGLLTDDRAPVGPLVLGDLWRQLVSSP